MDTMKDLLALIVGLIFGVYLPLVIIYFVGFFRKRSFGFRLIWPFFLRLVLALIIYGLVIIACVFALSAILPEELTPSDTRAFGLFGLGIVFGFVGGVIFFIVGVIRGRRKRAATTS